MTNFLAYAAAFIATYIGTAAFRKWSVGRGILDVPNERSSHVKPTPRGGGVVFVIVVLIGYAVLATTTNALPWTYVVAGLLVAGVSWIDDLRSISFAWRLLIHFVAAGVLLADRAAHSANTISGVLALAFAILWIVWMINAYNFMDGIDGIASVQAVIAALSWTVFAIVHQRYELSVFAGLLAAAVSGFLIHNWQPARIFMGDVGSAFLGFTLASFPFLPKENGTLAFDLYIAAGIVFLWFFAFDTLLTLARRIWRREKVWEAHRSHLYQRMVIGGMEHSTVTLIYGTFAAVLSGIFIISSQRSLSGFHPAGAAAVAATSVILSAALFLLSQRKAINSR